SAGWCWAICRSQNCSKSPKRPIKAPLRSRTKTQSADHLSFNCSHSVSNQVLIFCAMSVRRSAFGQEFLVIGNVSVEKLVRQCTHAQIGAHRLAIGDAAV